VRRAALAIAASLVALAAGCAGGSGTAPSARTESAAAVARELGFASLAPRLSGVDLDVTRDHVTVRGLRTPLPAGPARWSLRTSDTIGAAVAIAAPKRTLEALDPVLGLRAALPGVDLDALLAPLADITLAVEAACPAPGPLTCHAAITAVAHVRDPAALQRALDALMPTLPKLFGSLGFGPLHIRRDAHGLTLLARTPDEVVRYELVGDTFRAQVGAIPLPSTRTAPAPDVNGSMVVYGSAARLSSILPDWLHVTPAGERLLVGLGHFRAGISSG
jgi:hypothetical protein